MFHCLDRPQFIWQILFSLWPHSAMEARTLEARGVRSQAQPFPVASAEVSIRTQRWGVTPPKAWSLWLQGFSSASWHVKGRGLLPRTQCTKIILKLQFHSWNLNSLIKQNRKSEIHWLQNRGIDDTCQVLRKPLAVRMFSHISKYLIYPASTSTQYYICKN